MSSTELRFNDADKLRILKQAARADASAAQVARRYGIAPRLLRRWKQELAPEPTFVTVEPRHVDLKRACPS
jgi:transposase-like protein